VKIGVVIPTYNRAALCLETLDSVLAQQPCPDEIVVVDDGSTDETSAVLEPYRARGVQYVFQENAGLSAARNTGEAALSPEIEAVLFLDSDDRLLPGALPRLHDVLAANPAACLAYGRPRFIGMDGAPTTLQWGLEDFDGPNLWERLAPRNFICTAGLVLLRRSYLKQAGEFDTSLRSSEDWDMWLRLAETGAAFVRVPHPQEPVLEYRVHPESMSRNRTRMWENEERVYRKHIERASENPARRELLESLLAQRKERLEASDGVSAEEALLSRKHRLLRRMVEWTGMAWLYRRVPLAVRLRMRGLFGVDRWA
jgi:glycosyltransferase involved in cell wall biosynthesis